MDDEDVEAVCLRVRYNRLEVETIESQWSIAFDEMISNFGGQLGLWVGLSLVTLIHAPMAVIFQWINRLYAK